MWKVGMDILKGILYVSNLAVEALSLAMSQLSLTPNQAYNGYYYSMYTFQNLAVFQSWVSQSLQTMNTNLASGIDQGTQYIADQIGTPNPPGPNPPGPGRRLNGASKDRQTLFSMLGEIGASLKEMSDDINNMSCNQENNRGKTAKASKKAKKKQNLFDQAMVDDEEKISPGQNRLLLRVMRSRLKQKLTLRLPFLKTRWSIRGKEVVELDAGQVRGELTCAAS